MPCPFPSPGCSAGCSAPSAAGGCEPGGLSLPGTLAAEAMLQSLWHFLSSFLPRAVCQGPAAEKEDEAGNGSPLPGPGEKGPKMVGKPQDRGTDPTERRPTILLVVGPAEHFPKVTGPPGACRGVGQASGEQGERSGPSRVCVCLGRGRQQRAGPTRGLARRETGGSRGTAAKGRCNLLGVMLKEKNTYKGRRGSGILGDLEGRGW